MALDWPSAFERTPGHERKPYPHGFRVGRAQAFDNIVDELRKMDATQVRIETAAPHTNKQPHRPYAGSSPDDPGVVAYFERQGQQFAVPCDRWDNLRDNAQAIAKYLDAKRALNRYGVTTVESEFTTQRLPAGDAPSTEQPPHEVLGIAPDAAPEVIRAAARSLKKKHHPDRDGDRELFKRIVDAEQELLEGER